MSALMSDLVKKEEQSLNRRENKLVHFFMSSKGYVPIDPPKFAEDLECPFCLEKKFFLFQVDKEKTAWGCGRVCEHSKLVSLNVGGCIQPKVSRALEWPLFCEINGIGDEHYDVKFEQVQQSPAKLEYMLKFATSPRGVIFMEGDPGTGKTYAAMAMCEFFTRTNNFCIFTTQKQMAHNWIISHGDHTNNYVNNVLTTPLLVVDDFATGEPNPKFLEFFMEVVNTRLQWKSRGTVITTNLKVEKFSDFCGEALSDRIMTGQIFSFRGKTRRKKTIL